MFSRVQKWAGGVLFVAFLSVMVVSLAASPIRAEQAVGQGDNEVTFDSLRLPGRGDGDPGNPGDPISPRQGADPNDFSVSSPRPPRVDVTEVPRIDLLQLLRTALHFWLSRLAGPFHGA